MREIKFRAWDKFTEKMIFEGFHVIGEVTCFNGIEQYGDEYPNPKHGSSLARLDDFVLQQYTGLKDKNGKEIYEGDIILISKERMKLIGGSLMKVVIGFKDGSFMVGRNNHEHLNTYLWLLVKWEPEDVKIIGNIYENKNLLEEAE